MDFKVTRPVGRPRKRRPDDVKNVPSNQQQSGNHQPKKRAFETRGLTMVGRYVLREFRGSEVFLGKIAYYDSGLYRVYYEDGYSEDSDSGVLRHYLIGGEYFDDDLNERKNKLDEFVAKNGAKLENELDKGSLVIAKNKLDKEELESPISDLEKGDLVTAARYMDEVSRVSELSNGEANYNEIDDDAGSSSDSCEYAQEWDMGPESDAPVIPPPELPPSSLTIGLPEEYVPHLFSVYGFLRSFSIRLFLSPFTLDDLVGCLNCPIPSSLLDAIHVSLLRAVRRHLEALSSDGSELASKCLRSIDWSLLDILTWPVYLVHYLMVRGYLNGDEWKGFCVDVLQKDYCSLSVRKKLLVLQILCDDALESAEIRAEIDMREESEVGIDADGLVSIPPESGPKRVHPRYPKTFAGKANEVMVTGVECNGTVPSTSSSMGLRGNDPNGDAAVIDEDGNGDDCQLCGMDGTLLCCDGCPSAYHSRCIGVNKIHIPEGPWFCPECTISKVGPTVTVGTSLKGATLFGIDSYEQVFLGTCNHLLVLKISVNTLLFVRYYNRNDIPEVLRALYSSVQFSVLYSGLCQAILKYWELPQEILPLPETVQKSIDLESQDKKVILPTPVHPFTESEYQKIIEKVVAEECTNAGERNSLSGSCSNRNTMLSAQAKIDSTVFSSSINQEVELSGLTHHGLGDGSGVADLASCTSGYNNTSVRGPKNGLCFSVNSSSCRKEGINGGDPKLRDNCLYMGSSFKPHLYLNHYVHGDFAASAAASLAFLSSEENRTCEVQASDNPRKVMSANALLQVKAFSLTAIRFFWPNTEKKLVEVPRERCGWCLNCKAPPTSKKACLLNSVALNATKGAMKIISALRLAKNVEGSLYGIAMYTLYMEESLQGLIVGPFLSASYRQQWRKNVEQVSSCSEIKILLLQLEENLRPIALSGDWIKLVDNLMNESSVSQITCPAVSTQKCVPSVRRGRKRLSTYEVTADYEKTDFIWWRGGKLSKLVFQRGTLPRALLRKAARKGGSRKIYGIYYAEGSEIPKRSRQLIWRAAVEMSSNASQLALQIRYLDHYIRWSDLVRPEQQDGKGPETEAFAFRNASICDKKLTENKILYGVAFSHQRHLPSRVMKSIIEKEENQAGKKDKYWFLETRVPLYLIKEYEENAEKAVFPAVENPPTLSRLQRQQLKDSRKNVFSYLALKRDHRAICSCASCHLDVLLGSAVKCIVCEGYCHKGCTMRSTSQTIEDVDFMITCKLCYQGKALPQNDSGVDVESPTSPLAMQGQEYRNTATASKNAKERGNHQKSSSVGTLESSSEKKPAAPSSSLTTKSRKKSTTWGLIWKKKITEDMGTEFRLKHILRRGNPDNIDVENVVCHLCHKPYHPHFVYIHCETCKNWYHADAVELDESRIPDLMGFKCCRCRRIKLPACPYSDPDQKKARPKVSKRREGGIDSVSGSIYDQNESSIPTSPFSPMEEDVLIQVDDDPILFSISKVELIPKQREEADLEWDAPSGLGPQKLPVRRHLKHENDVDGFTEISPSQFDLPSGPLESKSLFHTAENLPSSSTEWDACASGGCGEDGLIFDDENFDYADTVYEPQTYFSFTELLASDDGVQPGSDDASGNMSVSWEILTSKNSNDYVEPQRSVEAAVDLPCRVCSKRVPAPDLSCRGCGLCIHNHCSPWEEDLSPEESWTCGNCRAWR
ncbi:hypothetical protein Nepgr_012953 [Nepenthes gracilis]|uniref:Uncharacterized protein n=1 Tax=Nepenthes gracilis TaxID=150966 RepID=A0AAD3XN84_NEPGR|nr:hypothetical protein Nepgr_012953 [Nepenthes gracilis]